MGFLNEYLETPKQTNPDFLGLLTAIRSNGKSGLSRLLLFNLKYLKWSLMTKIVQLAGHERNEIR